ncbi:MAG: COX15/CtaA family protein [Actinobacteria bacterium]|nr:COX15/CtaA family protein [Actinomycetota bacterium]
MDLVGSPAALRRWAVASLVGNMGIVVTGGLVRLTGSGLGCSTWPQCEPGSITPPEASLHASIEFGNRLLTFVLVVLAVGTFVAAWKARDDAGAPRRRTRRLALAAALGIPAQAIIGGFSVLAGLNPWVVGLHMVVSVALIAVCTVLVHDAYGWRPAAARPLARMLARVAFWVGMASMALGVVATGAGPHAGDSDSARNGLDVVAATRVHSLSVWVVVALTIALVLLTTGAARRAAVLLLAVELAQGAIGYAQYLLGLPVPLVALHMLGLTVFTAALANLWWLVRDTRPADAELPAGAGALRTAGDPPQQP